jgi:DNA modification methylase
MREQGFHWSSTIIWAKDQFVLGRSKYHRRYEPIWYGWHGSGKSSFVGGRDQDDVWEVVRPKRSEEHPTMKPVELIEKAVKNSSQVGDVVFEPFAGSGSTIIACEHLGRHCRAVEISPEYCAVTINRWAEMTSQEPVLIG